LLQVSKLAAVDGALDISTGYVVLTKATAGAYTLAAPALSDNGKAVLVVSATAAAHTVTQASPGFNGGGGSNDVATFGAAIGNSMTLVAHGGAWLATNLTGVTIG
jgi:hypothetical protein